MIFRAHFTYFPRGRSCYNVPQISTGVHTLIGVSFQLMLWPIAILPLRLIQGDEAYFQNDHSVYQQVSKPG